MKRFLPILIIVFAISTFLLPSFSRAQVSPDIQSKIAETQRQRDALLEEQKRLQATLDQVSKEGQTLSTSVKTLDATKQKLANDLKLTQANITASNLTIQKLTSDIDKNESQIATSKEAISESVKKLNDYESHTTIFNLLAYNTLTEVWTDTANLMDTQDSLSQAIDTLNQNQKELQTNKTAKEAQKSNLISLSSQLSGQKTVVEETQSAKTKLLAETRNKEAAYQKLLADNIAQEKAFEAQLFQYESQLQASNPAETPTARHSELSWPLANITVTQQFGKTSSSGRLYASGTHNGVDFRATVGTAVMAPRGGFVKAMGNTDDAKGCYSYGRWILIQHDDGLSSIYGHLSAAIVTTGQIITTGQVIGYSGGAPGAYGSGYSTGPHLHFGLFATAGVTVQRYSSSINCKSVSIPIANPQDYLDPLAYMPSL